MNRLLHRVLATAFQSGTLEVVDGEGQVHVFGDRTGDPVRVRFTSPEAERALLLNPDLAIGEIYMDGGLTVERPSVYDFLLLTIRNVGDGRAVSWLQHLHRSVRGITRTIRQRNRVRAARRNAHHHYDIGNDLYRLFLDADMQYSCAYFETGAEDIDQAQLAKKRHIAAKLMLEPGQRVLDIGCGWGGLALYLADLTGTSVVGVTLAEEQQKVAVERAAAAGLADRAQFLLKDYREVTDTFDRIVSVGMFEHVGPANYRTFFQRCYDILPDDGVMLLHTIGRSGPPGDTNAWLEKYIFPGGYTPALSEVTQAIEKTGLIISDLEILRLHYAETLRAWRERFLSHRDEALQLYDERFCRMWEFYLAACEAVFRASDSVVFQIQLVKNKAAVPQTRDYMSASERTLRSRERDRALPASAAAAE